MAFKVLGVDGGATKTVAALVEERGKVLGVGTAGGANPLHWGEAAFENIRSACDAALVIGQSEWGEVAFVFVGMSGVDEPGTSSHRSASERLRSHLPTPFTLDNDSFIAHAGAFAGDEGVIVVAGTGSIALGLAKGQRIRVDGMGWWFGDEGSCVWITLEALRLAARAQDGRGKPTRLTEALLSSLNASDLREVATLLATGNLSKDELAWAAKKVAEVAGEGDEVANQVLKEAADRLARSALTAWKRLSSLTGLRPSISYTGGVFRLTQKMPELFVERVKAYLPRAEIIPPRLPPHLGAALLAAKEVGWSITKTWLHRISETGKEWGYFDIRAGLVEVLPRLLSERPNPASAFLDRLEVEDILGLINDEDHKVAPAVRREIPAIAEAVRWAVRALKRGGRIIHVGAGTSGRLGVMDAAECPPTFGIPPDRVIGVIAGGPEAFSQAKEGAEDDMDAGREEMRKLRVNERDVVIGLSVSGRTPFVIAALDEAKKRGARTVAVTVNRDAPIASVSDLIIAPVVGPEILSGSTRMKAGTAQKMILTMLSTATMVKLGRVQSNLMVDLQTWSVKLRERAKRIVAQISGVSLDEAERALEANNWEVRKALAALRRQS